MYSIKARENSNGSNATKTNAMTNQFPFCFHAPPVPLANMYRFLLFSLHIHARLLAVLLRKLSRWHSSRVEPVCYTGGSRQSLMTLIFSYHSTFSSYPSPSTSRRDLRRLPSPCSAFLSIL